VIAGNREDVRETRNIHPLRLGGAALLVGASLWAIASPQPDVLVATMAQTVAIRGPDGRLSILRSSRDSFAVKEWLAADADARRPKDPSLNVGVQPALL
jgi:competence protein ComEC